MSSAQFHLRPEVDAHESGDAFHHEDGEHTPAFVLKQQVAERLAEHRARRKGSSARTAPTPIAAPASSRKARIAATVAERYAHSQSYRAFLAAEAERAIHEAEAAAEIAVRNARAVADAQLDLLEELDQWSLTPPPAPENCDAEHVAATMAAFEAAPVAHSDAPLHQGGAGLTIRLYNEAAPTLPEPVSDHLHTNALMVPLDEEERLALDEEIEFRQSPVFEEPAGPPIDIPANLIEFPRQLIAARRARPRIAEGPLRDEADHAPDSAQLRIFEVEATQISTAPAVESPASDWSAIVLDAHPAQHTAIQESDHASTDRYVASGFEPYVAPVLLKDAASIELRLMAGIVDGCLVLAGFLAFAAAFALATTPSASSAGPLSLHNVTLQNLALGAAASIFGLAVIYQLLFFTFSTATPGMKYARIALCTFSDDNPTPSALRRRALALAACPPGIGLLWAWFDNDRLGWHDRLSGMYQRHY